MELSIVEIAPPDANIFQVLTNMDVDRLTSFAQNWRSENKEGGKNSFIKYFVKKKPELNTKTYMFSTEAEARRHLDYKLR